MRVIRAINRGGFGFVEEVEDSNGNRFARKTFSPSFAVGSDQEREKLLKRFIREARVQSSLNSPGIVPIVGEDLTGSAPDYLMPVAERNLAAEIDAVKAGASSPKRSLADILNALDELHELGYVHRDLKPANVLFWKARGD